MSIRLRTLTLALFAPLGLFHAPAEAHVWRFEANVGQTDREARFVARGPGYRAFFTEQGAVLDVGRGDRRAVVRIGPADGRALAVDGERRQDAIVSYGSLEPFESRGQVAVYDRLRYRAAFAGADLVYYGRDGQLEFDVELAPRADVASVRLRIDGARSLAIDAEGGLVAGTGSTPLRFRPPVAYQESPGGERIAVASRFVLDAERSEVGFAVGEYDRERPLVIDPVIVFSAFLGGEGSPLGEEEVRDVAVDAAGNIYAVGTTVSLDFPTVGAGGCHDQLNDSPAHSSCATTPWIDQSDAFVTKIAPDGETVLYSMYLGDDSSEIANAVAVNAAGEAYVVGSRYIAGVGESSRQGFVARIAADGSAILFAQVFGDILFPDSAEDVAIDAAGNVFVGGYVSEEAGFNPALPGLDHDFDDIKDGFLLKYSQSPTTNALAAWTYLGGPGVQDVTAIAMGTDNTVVATGTNLNAAVTDHNVYVLRMSNALTTITAGPAYITGTSGQEAPRDIAVDPTNRVWVAGDTTSANLCESTPPIPGLDPMFNAPNDGFAFRLTSNLAAADYCTFLGGNGCDWVYGIALDGNLIAFTGTTIPGGSTCGLTERDGANAFLVGVQESPAALRFTYQFGGAAGASSDEGKAIVRAPDGTFVLAGRAGSASFPTTPNSFQFEYPASAANETGFVMKVDPVTRLSIFDKSRTEGSGGGTTAFEFELSLNGWPLDNVSYTLNTANGTASAPGDYAARTGVVCTNCFVPFGSGYRTETVNVVADSTVEGNETFQVNLSSPVNAILGDGSATGTIVNDDSAPLAGAIQWQAATFAAGEAAGTFNLVVTRTGGTAAGATAQYAVTAGTANGSGVDYTLASGTVTFGLNETTRNVPVAIVADTLDESNETVVVTLSNPGGGATLGSPVATTLTITDDDTGGTIQWQSATFTAGEAAGTFQLVVSRSAGAASGATAQYAVTAGTANGSGNDYTLASGTVTFGASETSRNVPVTIVNDTRDESNETVVVTLSNPGGGATLGSPTATTLTITDDDTAGTIQFQITESAAGEGIGGSIVSVSRSGGAASGATVQYAVTGGTATGGGVDYTLAAGTLTFPANDNQETFSLAIVDDTLDESDETVVITLSNPGGGAVLGASTVHTFTLADNDDPTSTAGTLRFTTSGGVGTEGPGAEICITVERLNGSTGSVGVQVTTNGVTATAGSDFVPGPYPLSWPNGDATSRQVCVELLHDTTDEPDEFFNIELVNPTGGAVLGTWSVITLGILDDDPTGQLFRDGFATGDRTQWSASVP